MKTLKVIVFAVLFAAGSVPAMAQHMQMGGQKKAMGVQQMDSTGNAGMMHSQLMGMRNCPMMQQRMGAMHAMNGNGMGMMDMGMMDMNTMRRAMHDPAAKAVMMVEMLPTMKDLLGLSDEQVKGLVEMQHQYQEHHSELIKQSSDAEAKVDELLGSENPDSSAVKAMLREAAMHRADARALGIETSIRMKAMLDNGQRQQLMNMTPQGMYRHAASHMPMMQMMQMMRGGGMARCSRGAL